VDAPTGTSKIVRVSGQEAAALAYYSSPGGISVLAPRGWHCFQVYGSSGASLYVSPSPIDRRVIFSPDWKGFSGPAIEAQWRCGDTSGRDSVAEVIALVFPSHESFVREVMRAFEMPESSFHFGAYPTDKLAYRSKTVVEYETPAGREGVGTKSRLKINNRPIQGVAILAGKTPDLLHLAARLPDDLSWLTPAIMRQFESDAAHMPKY